MPETTTFEDTTTEVVAAPVVRHLCDWCATVAEQGPDESDPARQHPRYQIAMHLLPGSWSRLGGCSAHSLDRPGHEWDPATDPDPDVCRVDTCPDNEFHRESAPGQVCPGCGTVLGMFHDLWAFVRDDHVDVVARDRWGHVTARTPIVSLDDISTHTIAALGMDELDRTELHRVVVELRDGADVRVGGASGHDLAIETYRTPGVVSTELVHTEVVARHTQGHPSDHWTKRVPIASLAEVDLSVMAELDCYTHAYTDRDMVQRAIQELVTTGSTQIGWADLAIEHVRNEPEEA